LLDAAILLRDALYSVNALSFYEPSFLLRSFLPLEGASVKTHPQEA